MKNHRAALWRGTFVLLGLLAAIPSFGESFAPLSFRAQFRDAIGLGTSGDFAVSAYDLNEVWRINAEGTTTVGRVAVGAGPGALALSNDGNTLACVNHLDGTVTLVRVQGFEVSATLSVGKGSRHITALPGGGFAVSNQDEDSIAIIDEESGSISVTLTDVASVPGSIAASSQFLVVATRVPAAVLVYVAGGETPVRTIELEGPATDLLAIDGNSFLVATASALTVVDVSTGSTLRSSQAGARKIALYGDRVAALRGAAVDILDAQSLEPAETFALPVTGYSVGTVGNTLAALDPANTRLYLLGDTAVEDLAEPVAEEAPSNYPVRVEAESVVPEPEPEQPEVVDVAKAETVQPPEPLERETAAPEREELEIAEPENDVPEVVEPETKAEEIADEESGEVETGRRDDRRSRRSERIQNVTDRRPSRTPLAAPETRAPYPLAPSSSPLARQSQSSFSDALSGGFSLGTTNDGFYIPDLKEAVAGVKANELAVDINFENIMAKGDVRFELDETKLTTESFNYSEATGEAEAIGDVLVVQGASRIEADRLLIRQELEPDSAESEVLESPEPKELSLTKGGYFEAEMFRLVEPHREIVADYIEYDVSAGTGKVLHAHGRLGVLYFGAEDLEILGPNSAIGHDVWVTTCDHPEPHYRIRLSEAEIEGGAVVLGTNAQLQLGRMGTPVWVPKVQSGSGEGGRDFSFDFDSGRQAEIGSFVNVGVWTPLTTSSEVGFRIMPTTKEGVGGGIDLRYDTMNKPASPFFRSRGSLQTMYTTQDRGYSQFYHRQELSPNLVLLAQWEQWFDEDFVKDFFYDVYRNRTGPRAFVNLTRTGEGNILSTTVSPSPNGFAEETEKLPEVAFHMLEREIAPNLYLSFDTVSGYYERSVDSLDSGRSVNSMRLTYDINVGEGLNIAPFLEPEVVWYDKTLIDEDSEVVLTGIAGVTFQSRFQRAYGGAAGFSGFKHVVIPSLTYFYRPDGDLSGDDTPQFDSLDLRPGRSRVEAKLENVLLGRDAETGESWQVARASYYMGYDIQNETRETRDHEVEVDLRPRPWWGVQTVWENHRIEGETDPLRFFPTYQQIRRLRDRLFTRLGRDDLIEPIDGDFSRVLSYFYYDDTALEGQFNARLGFAYTETDNEVFNREILYGLGYRISDKWGLAFEHRYDLERSELVQQTYEIRRRLHCWDAAIRVRERNSGFDVKFEFSLAVFPGTKVKF